MQAGFVDYQHLAGFDLANIFCIDQIERTGFRRDAPSSVKLTQNQRAKAARIANGDQRFWSQKQQRECSFSFL